MAPHALIAFQWLLLAGCISASIYTVTAALAMPFFTARHKSNHHGGRAFYRAHSRSPVDLAERPAAPFAQVGVSVLKPLCGAEPRLYENLRTFCEQRHQHFQLVLGVSSPHDPAIAVVRRLQAAYPKCDIELAIDTRVHGSNLKVSNLINMAARARHDVIVIADSDIAVDSDYLDSVAAPLADPNVGVVTCLYVARGVGGFWPRVGALFINEWFAPSVRVAHAMGSRRFGFGATLALRRATLERIGGFEALKNCLADDYWLAEHVRELGLQTVLSRVMVATDVIEPTFAALWQRETRWLRTIRSVNPPGFVSLLITFPTPWLMMSAWLTVSLAHASVTAVAASASATAVCVGARLLLHLRASRRARTFWRDLPLVPLRDTLLALQWLVSAFGSHVVWRGARMQVRRPAAERSGQLDSLT
ncbi:bacteriohopanetetrol glucosamine biosynthesis glycosyltransferase HpnI [Paraburkholderia sp. MMS20-SJTN17]|uniref:Bacteriohopanetetrol glucosamine biosynthesis glycosyltransferase HpnI n=1 Tax=Paraburkholderia translucens TaxID=2886945 RepID=A0ABS8KJ81_9BURK|nr:bacteriohopanetetrol glucosamine biosynthesis glycosyltransferase HpnI [Paraburkholderia sp. MMS20-SJTN17]MCC8404831.1 bacteriohopanetetrol glucosamine biosynthesis glycosyltransferase HpnI [Paraburkholderia sp. MMS20-SJTN17]